MGLKKRLWCSASRVFVLWFLGFHAEFVGVNVLHSSQCSDEEAGRLNFTRRGANARLLQCTLILLCPGIVLYESIEVHEKTEKLFGLLRSLSMKLRAVVRSTAFVKFDSICSDILICRHDDLRDTSRCHRQRVFNLKFGSQRSLAVSRSNSQTLGCASISRHTRRCRKCTLGSSS